MDLFLAISVRTIFEFGELRGHRKRKYSYYIDFVQTGFDILIFDTEGLSELVCESFIGLVFI